MLLLSWHLAETVGLSNPNPENTLPGLFIVPYFPVKSARPSVMTFILVEFVAVLDSLKPCLVDYE